MLIFLLIICVVTDIRERKIYNKVLFPFLILAILGHLIESGWSGISFSLFGFLTGFIILLLPYLLGGMGAGDIKLLAVIGAIKGTKFVLLSSLYMGIFGGIIAVLIVLFRKNVRQKMYETAYFLVGLLNGVRVPFSTERETLSTTYPYGVAIAIGALWMLFFPNGSMFV